MLVVCLQLHQLHSAIMVHLIVLHYNIAKSKFNYKRQWHFFSFTPTGLSIDPITGAVLPSASIPGVYTVSFSMPGCPNVVETTTVEISNNPTATITYAGPYSTSVSTAQAVNLTGTSGGAFSSSPVGLSIDAVTGDIIPSLSTAGTYTITYTISANPPCQSFTTTTTLLLLLLLQEYVILMEMLSFTLIMKVVCSTLILIKIFQI
jgi:hypothetical protein